MRAKIFSVAVPLLATLSALVGCARAGSGLSIGAGGEASDSTTAPADGGASATSAASGDGGAPGLISAAVGSPVGIGKLGVTGPLMQVTKLEAGLAIPQAFKITPTGPNAISLVSSTIDLLELQYDVSSWPPQQTFRRSLDTHVATLFDLADNGDFTYAFVSQAAIPGKYLIGESVTKDQRAEVRVAMAAAKMTASSSFSMARAGNENFWAFDVGGGATNETNPFFLGRQESGVIQVLPDPIICEPFSSDFLIGTTALADRFLTALAGGDASCVASKANTNEMISIVSVPRAGAFLPEVATTFDLGARPSGAILKPRADGAWLAIALPGELELLAVAGDGTILGAPTTVPAAIAMRPDLPAFDALPTDDGGLFVAWFANDAAITTVEIARFDERGVLVERGSLAGDPNLPFASSFSMAKHKGRYAIFLGLSRYRDGIGMVYAAEISDGP